MCVCMCVCGVFMGWFVCFCLENTDCYKFCYRDWFQRDRILRMSSLN